ncbi:MAG: hypothetical protein RL305_361, partial [Pseudomonadota bacterium]
MFLKLQFVKKKFFLKDSFRISRENKKILNLIIIKLTENDKCGFAECVPYKRYGESQKKIFSYLTNNQSKILKLIRHNKLEKIKYLSLRTALELALKHLNINKENRYYLKKKYPTFITIPIFSQKKIKKIIYKFKNVNFIKVKVNKKNILKTIKFINKNCPNKYQGLDRFEARKLIIDDLKSINALEKEEIIKHNVPYGDRSNSIIEPYLTEQWFLNVKKMSTEALKAVKNKKTIFFPEAWTKNYNLWLKDIQPWCISRQIWWGHQIPIWYGNDGKIFSAKDQIDAQKQADKYYKKKNSPINQDKDVLDTWFSSA